MKDIFNDVLTQLKTINALRYIGIDEGQLDNPDEENNYPVMFPCALIDIEGIDWQTAGTFNQQNGEGELSILIAFQNPNRIENNVSDTRLTEALTRWAILDTVTAALHGLNGTGFNDIERKRTAKEKRPGMVKLFTVTFRFNADETIS